MKLMLVLGAVGLACGARAVETKQAMPEQSVYEVAYRPGADLTGNLADWKGIGEGTLSVPMRESVTPVPAGLKLNFRARITDTELQFLLTAKDPTRVFAVSRGAKYLNDCFEIYLDPLYTRDVALDATMSQTSVTPKDADGREMSVSGPLPGARARRVDFPGGWAAEVAFPLRNRQFEMTPFDGLAFGCNVAYSNNDHPGKRTVDHKIGWSSLDDTDSSWQTPAVYGEFRVRAPGKTVRVPVKAGPAQAEIKAKRTAGECCEDAAYLGSFRPEPAITRGFNMGVSESALAAAAEWGANNARFEIITGSAWKGLTLDQTIDRAVGIFTNGLIAARKTGVKLIVDGRGLPGRGSFVWTYREDYTKFLGALLRAAQPYKDALWAIDIMNEPLDFSQLPYPPIEFRQFFLETVRDLRKIDRDVWFIYDVGPGGGYYGFRDLKPLPDPRIIYACHFYDPGAFTHQGVDASLLLDQGLMPKAVQGNMRRYPGVYHGRWFDRAEIERRLQPVIDFQRKYQTPIYVGEFSCVSWAPVESTTQYLQDLVDVFEKYGWSWSYHCFRGWPGWNLDTEDGVLVKPKHGVPTKRAPIIRRALEKNRNGASAIPRETLAFNLDFWRFFYISAPGAADDPGIRASVVDADGAYSQAKRGYTPDEAGCLAYIDDILRGGVTRFISNINAQRCNVDSKVLEPVWANGEGGANPQYDQLVARSARLLHERGVNPHKVWFRRCREKNVEPWLSIRMNDMHGSDCPGSAAVSDFWREHPEYRRYPAGTPTNVWSWAAQSLDYAHEPVRRRMLAFIRECLENYDIDGIELDYTRFVWYFRPGREREDARFLTEFQREVRRMTDDAAKRTGHPVRISLRLLACPETEEALGLDIGTWAREGLMDIVDVGCHFCSNDFEIPLAAWRKRVGDRVEVLPHCDDGHSIYTPDWFRRRMNLEEYAGFADTVYAKGARGLSLFNLFGHPVDAPEWNEILVKGLGPKRIAEMPRRYPLSYRDMEFTEGAARAYPQLLPAALTNGFRCSIFIGTLPAKGTASLIVGLAGDGKGALPQACVNGVRLPAFTPREEPRCRGYESAVPLDALRAGRNEIVLDPADGAPLVYLALRVAGATLGADSGAKRTASYDIIR